MRSHRTLRVSARTLVMLFVCSFLVVVAVRRSAGAKAYAPEQPIAFSHVVHAGDDKLSCEFCHSTARRASFAGIAPVERCMGCHRYVIPENPEVVKLRRFWDAEEQIPWVKVYTLPRFVHFNHEAHMRAQVPCGTCHGTVQQMERVERVTDLTMGWCVGCHRARRASDDCLVCHY